MSVSVDGSSWNAIHSYRLCLPVLQLLYKIEASGKFKYTRIFGMSHARHFVIISNKQVC